MKTLLLKGLAIATLMAVSPTFAAEENLDVETKFRAKIAKEKVKQAAQERELDRKFGNLERGLDSDCGSQNIGNVNTGGRPGAAPREVFVFAPNAINVVGAGGCR